MGLGEAELWVVEGEEKGLVSKRTAATDLGAWAFVFSWSWVWWLGMRRRKAC